MGVCLITPKISQLFCPRATGSDRRIVDLPKYAHRQKCRGFTPRRGLYGNEPLKQLAPFAIAERIIAKPVGPDSLIGYQETSYYSELNYGSSIEGKDATNR